VVARAINPILRMNGENGLASAPCGAAGGSARKEWSASPGAADSIEYRRGRKRGAGVLDQRHR